MTIKQTQPGLMRIAAISAAPDRHVNIDRRRTNPAQHPAGAKTDAAKLNATAPLTWQAGGRRRRMWQSIQMGGRRWSGPAPA